MATKTITTPVGIARYPSLNRADTKFDEVGVYKVNLEMSSEDAEPFIKQAEALFAEFLEDKKRELKKDKLKLHAAPWEENDGLVQLKLKVKAMGKNKEGETFSRQPKLFGSDGQPITDNIGGGQDQSRGSALLLVHGQHSAPALRCSRRPSKSLTSLPGATAAARKPTAST
jgi:hypothetical protein